MTRKKNAILKTFDDEKVMENENCRKSYSKKQKNDGKTMEKIDGKEERREKR